MKKENFSNAISLINDDLIEQADASRKTNSKYKIFHIIRTSIAACLILVIAVTAVIVLPKFNKDTFTPQSNTSNQQTEDIKLPLLTISETVAGNDMGFGGYMAFDISEITNANPWYEGCGITTLPVYNNALEFNESYEPTNTDYDAMYELLYDIAKGLNINTDKLEIIQHDNEYHNPYPYLIYKDNSVTIDVQANLTALIDFDPALSLPEEYNFDYYAPYKDNVTVAKHLKNEFKNILFYKNPQPNIYGGDYWWLDDYSVKQNYHIQFYDKIGDITQDIINYNFNQTEFHTHNGHISGITIYKPDLSKKIGDYPIINVDIAKKTLENGNYITSVPYEFNGFEYVKKVELRYIISYREKIYMPYYLFYVELPDENSDHIAKGLKTYGLYYVPAVESKYISNMPVYDGSFN